jgi:hypothetical protein
MVPPIRRVIKHISGFKHNQVSASLCKVWGELEVWIVVKSLAFVPSRVGTRKGVEVLPFPRWEHDKLFPVEY